MESQKEIIDFINKQFLRPLTDDVKNKCKHYLKLVDNKKVNLSEDRINQLQVMAMIFEK